MKTKIASIAMMLMFIIIASSLGGTFASPSPYEAQNILEDSGITPPTYDLSLMPWNPALPYPEGTDIGNPLYVIQCERNATSIGAYAEVNPTTVRVDEHTGGIEEYWVSVVAVNTTAQYYAEVAVDVLFNKNTNLWETIVCSIYSNPSLWPGGQLKTSTSLGTSSTAPATPTVAIYRSSGNTWVFVVNGQQFDSYTYSASWTASKISTAMESYAQPHGWTSGQTIVTNANIHYKSSSDGIWYTASPTYTFKVPDSFQVSQTTSSTSQTVTSTRTW